MKRITMAILFIALLLGGAAFSQEKDNTFGENVIYSFGKNISLDLESARLEDVLKMLSQQTGLNFVSTEAVKDRKLTLYMENIPLKEAIDTIFKANNLAYDYYPQSNIFTIKETGKSDIELQAKVYYLKYTRLESSKIKKEVESLSSSEEGEGGESEGDDEEDTGIKAAIERVLSERGKVIEDPITNSLVVIDIPAQFPMIDAAIEKLDISVPKVMVEVEMLDVSKTHLDKMGLNFANGLYVSYTPGARSSLFPFESRLMKNATSSLTSSLTSAGETEESTASALMGVLDLRSFTAVLQMLTQDTNTKMIARPKILTLSNEVAEVNLISNEAIGVTTTTTDSGSTQSVEREETGTKLRVTPQVNPHTDEITLYVEVFNRESVDSGISITGMSTGNLKNVEERGARSLVRLKDGETLLIGGLIRKEESETTRKIPFLGDIPFLGRLFTYVERAAADNVERELLVFITPRVVKDDVSMVKEAKVLQREQQNASKNTSVKGVLDRLSR